MWQFHTASPFKAFLKLSMSLTVAVCLSANDAFAPESLVKMWLDWVEIWDVEATLRVMLRTMAELAMLVL